MKKSNNKISGKILIAVLAILFFPIFITIWILRSTKLSKKSKIIALLAMWVGIPALSVIFDFFTPDISGISYEDPSPIIIVVGKDSETEIINVETSKNNVVTDDSVLIIIDDPSIVSVIERSNEKDGKIFYKLWNKY